MGVYSLDLAREIAMKVKSNHGALAVATVERHVPAETRKENFIMPTVRILDPVMAEAYIRDRQERGVDRHDAVWEGAYIVPPLANNPHQGLVCDLSGILFLVIKLPGRGQVQAGTNVSDRRAKWEKKFRCPDVVVVLNEGQAVDCGTHWLGGPDFLVEIESPGDGTQDKIPFYSQLRVCELLIVQRDTRELTLYRHDGQQLVLVGPADLTGGKWLVSEVVPLAFRRKLVKKQPKTEIRRTDEQAGEWVV